MLEFQRGSREAFVELFARYREPLYAFFRRRLDANERAEDLTQETFLAVIEATPRYEQRALFRTYLYAIAMNLLNAERRKQVRSASAPLPDSVFRDESSDVFLWVRGAMDRLNVSDREILMLREYEHLSYAEISEVLRIPTNTVCSKLFRAREALKSHLDPQRRHGDEIRTRKAVREGNVKPTKDEV